MKTTNQFYSLFIPAVFIQFPLLLLATGGVHPAIAKAFNLALFLGVLYYLLRKPARAFFEQRKAQVRATLERAAKEKAEATTKMAELEARLSRLDTELAELRAQSEREASAERDRLHAETKVEAEKLRTTAQREIESAKQTALFELREFTAEQAVELAEQMIRRQLTPQDDARLLQQVGQELSKVR